MTNRSDESDALDRSVSNGSADPGAMKDRATIALVEQRTLLRACIARCLQEIASPDRIGAVGSVAELGDLVAASGAPDVVVVCVAGPGNIRAQIEQHQSFFADAGIAPFIIVLADGDNANDVFESLDAGAKGFIPTNVSLEVAIEAIRLVKAGGTYVPASSLLASRVVATQPGVREKPNGHGIFTERQFAVIEALRMGKANKIIAHDLNMRESTVKVHIRNIMRKLHATNRTQVAYLYQAMIAERRVGPESVSLASETANG